MNRSISERNKGISIRLRPMTTTDIPFGMWLKAQAGWNQTEAAERFLIPLSTLNQKIKRLGIDVRRRGRTEDALSTGIGK